MTPIYIPYPRLLCNDTAFVTFKQSVRQSDSDDWGGLSRSACALPRNQIHQKLFLKSFHCMTGSLQANAKSCQWVAKLAMLAMQECNPRTNWLMQPWHGPTPNAPLGLSPLGASRASRASRPVSQTAAQTKETPAGRRKASPGKKEELGHGHDMQLATPCNTLPQLGSGQILDHTAPLHHWAAGRLLARSSSCTLLRR